MIIFILLVVLYEISVPLGGSRPSAADEHARGKCPSNRAHTHPSTPWSWAVLHDTYGRPARVTRAGVGRSSLATSTRYRAAKGRSSHRPAGRDRGGLGAARADGLGRGSGLRLVRLMPTRPTPTSRGGIAIPKLPVYRRCASCPIVSTAATPLSLDTSNLRHHVAAWPAHRRATSVEVREAGLATSAGCAFPPRDHGKPLQPCPQSLVWAESREVSRPSHSTALPPLRAFPVGSGAVRSPLLGRVTTAGSTDDCNGDAETRPESRCRSSTADASGPFTGAVRSLGTRINHPIRDVPTRPGRVACVSGVQQGSLCSEAFQCPVARGQQWTVPHGAPRKR